MPSVTDRLLVMYGILLQRIFLCYSSCVQSDNGILYGWCKRLFVSELNNEYFLPDNIFRQFLRDSLF